MKKNILYYICAFIFPIILFLIVMYLRLGTLNPSYLVISDMEGQYRPLMEYQKDILNGKESITYSYNKLMGDEFYTTFTYYLSSPLNILLKFFNNITLGIFVIILLKLGLMALFMYFYLDYRFSQSKKTNFIFSLCYALMGYVVNYYFNIMWLDAIYMLPLTMFGLDRLIKDNKYYLYILSLSYIMISNYYMAYMVSIFLLLYFVYETILNNKLNKNNIIKFIISSILSALISSFILLPTIFEMKNFVTSTNSLSINSNYILNVLKYTLENMIIGVHNCSKVLNEYGAYLYVTNFIYVLCILYFMDKKISTKEKILSFSVITLFILSFIILPLTFIWHASIPTFYNNRNAFLLSLFLILIARKEFDNINLNSYKNLIIILLYLIFGIISFLLFGLIIKNNIIITFIFLLSYLYVFNYKDKIKNNIFIVIICILVILELFVNFALSFVSRTKLPYDYDKYNNNVCSLINSSEYRGENYIWMTGIDSLKCNYSSTSLFLSTLKKNDYNFFTKYGNFSSGKVIVNRDNNTLFYNSILGVKNVIIDNSSDDDYINTNKRIKYGEKNYYLYINEKALKRGFIVNNIDVKTDNDPFNNQNNLLKSMTGLNDILFTKVDYDNIDKNTYIIHNNKDKFYIYVISNNFVNDFKINDKAFKKLFDEKNKGAAINGINNIVFKITSNIDNTKIKSDLNFDLYSVYKINRIVEKEALDLLSENQMDTISINKNELIGSIDAKKDGYLLLTIPYNKHFKMYVDNKKVDIEKAYDYFISTKISSGKHRIKLIYDSNYIRISVIISILSVIITCYTVKKMSKK